MEDSDEKIILSGWVDYDRLFKWPYRDDQGTWQLAPVATQRRVVLVNGKRKYEYREREESQAEWDGRQF